VLRCTKGKYVRNSRVIYRGFDLNTALDLANFFCDSVFIKLTSKMSATPGYFKKEKMKLEDVFIKVYKGKPTVTDA